MSFASDSVRFLMFLLLTTADCCAVAVAAWLLDLLSNLDADDLMGDASSDDSDDAEFTLLLLIRFGLLFSLFGAADDVPFFVGLDAAFLAQLCGGMDARATLLCGGGSALFAPPPLLPIMRLMRSKKPNDSRFLRVLDMSFTVFSGE